MIPPRPLFPLSLLLISLGLSSALDLQAQTPQPASIQGRVISRAGAPITEAEVMVMGTATQTLTDSAGRFQLRAITPGTVVVRIRRIGFKGQFLQVTLGPGASPTTEVMLDPGPQLLPEVTVTVKEAKPLEFAWTTKYDDYFRRRWWGLPGGTFITAEDIRRQPALHLWEVLEHLVPGTRVVEHFLGEGGTEIKFPRCMAGYVGVWLNGRLLNWQSGYQKAVQLNLQMIPQGGSTATALADVLAPINPSEIQFMEVYRGQGRIPGEFSTAGCGATVIWTR